MSVMATSRTEGGAFLEGRRRSALALIAGALVMELVIQQQVIKFYYTPLIIGLTYLAAAALAGRKGALWAPGIVTSCWGIAVILGVKNVVTLDSKASYLIAGAIGVAIALALRYTIGLAAGPIGLAVSIAVILVHEYVPTPSWVYQGVTFAVLLGVWGLWELRPSKAPSTAKADDSAGTTESKHDVDLRDEAPRSSTRV